MRFAKVHRGQDNDWDMLPSRVFIDLADEFKAIHFGHHQVEQNDIWGDRLKEIDRFMSVLGSVYKPPMFFQCAAGQFDGLRIILDK